MSQVPNAPDAARSQLLNLMDQLCALAEQEEQADQAAFFERIRAGLRNARDANDLAGPFMELSTSAFRGFLFSPPVEILLDHVLAIAQTLSATLAADDDLPH